MEEYLNWFIFLILIVSITFTPEAIAQQTPAEIQAYCQRFKNTEATGENNLYPAQFPTCVAMYEWERIHL